MNTVYRELVFHSNTVYQELVRFRVLEVQVELYVLTCDENIGGSKLFSLVLD